MNAFCKCHRIDFRSQGENRLNTSGFVLDLETLLSLKIQNKYIEVSNLLLCMRLKLDSVAIQHALMYKSLFSISTYTDTEIPMNIQVF